MLFSNILFEGIYMQKVILGSDYFPKFVQKDAFFVDKSLLIKQIIEDSSEVLLSCPLTRLIEL